MTRKNRLYSLAFVAAIFGFGSIAAPAVETAKKLAPRAAKTVQAAAEKAASPVLALPLVRPAL